MQSGNKTNIPVLTGIRALAALLVFLHHFLSPPASNPVAYSGSIIAHFHIGVSLFFVLSGFLIHYKYFEILSGGTNGWRSFFLHRFARIMPLYLFLLALTFPVLYFYENGSFIKNISLFFLSISLLKGFVPEALFSGIPQGWSLTVEFCFYLSAPILFYFFRNKAHLYLLTSISLFFLAYFLESVHMGRATNGQGPFFLTYTIAGRSFEFFAGCFLSAGLKRENKSANPLPVFTLAGIGGISIILIGLTNPLLSKMLVLNFLILNLLVPVFIVTFYKGLLSENSILKTFLCLEFVQLLGRISFAFYLIHVGVMERFLSSFVTNHVLLLYVILNFLAWFLYQFVELPARQWLLKRFSI